MRVIKNERARGVSEPPPPRNDRKVTQEEMQMFGWQRSKGHFISSLLFSSSSHIRLTFICYLSFYVLLITH